MFLDRYAVYANTASRKGVSLRWLDCDTLQTADLPVTKDHNDELIGLDVNRDGSLLLVAYRWDDFTSLYLVDKSLATRQLDAPGWEGVAARDVRWSRESGWLECVEPRRNIRWRTPIDVEHCTATWSPQPVFEPTPAGLAAAARLGATEALTGLLDQSNELTADQWWYVAQAALDGGQTNCLQLLWPRLVVVNRNVLFREAAARNQLDIVRAMLGVERPRRS